MENYSLWDHGSFLRDRTRVRAFEDVLRRLLTPNCAVLDIGTGTGIMAIAAAKMGAGHVDAIEPDWVIGVARGLAEENGVEGKINFYRGSFSEFVAGRHYDLIISDLRGCLPYYGTNVSVLNCARGLVAPNGHLVPARDEVYVAPVSSPRVFRDYLDPWSRSPMGVTLNHGRDWTQSHIRVVQCTPGELAGEAQVWSKLTYDGNASSSHRARNFWMMQEARELHGFVAWFRSELCEGVVLDAGPSAKPLIYGQLFFPLHQPESVKVNDRLELVLGVKNDRAENVWSWEVSVQSQSSPPRILGVSSVAT